MTDNRAVVLEAFGQPVTLHHGEMPAPEAGAAVARIAYGGICGTDVHLQQGRLPIPTPVVLGHEAVGAIERLGDGLATDASGLPLREGDRVTWASNIPCGRCPACLLEGERTMCANRRIYGINQRFDEWPSLSGGWGDRIYLQPNTTIVRLPDEVSFEQVIALGCAGPTVIHGLLHRARVQVGDTVIVQGAGPVGLAASLFARLAGAAKVILVGGPTTRLALIQELGIADVLVDIERIPTASERADLVLQETTRGVGADVVVECTGVPAAVAEGMDLCRPSGKYVILGQYTDHGPTPINPHLITRKQLQVVGSWAFAERHYVEYARSVPRLAELCDLTRLLSVYGLESANVALADVASGQALKAVLSPQAAGAGVPRRG
jgi:threonine dehydrogenase-like Zn-dependent dehydrogenase